MAHEGPAVHRLVRNSAASKLQLLTPIQRAAHTARLFGENRGFIGAPVKTVSRDSMNEAYRGIARPRDVEARVREWR